MPPGNKKNKNNVKTCASTVANTDVISMCVIPVKVKYKIQILFIAPLPCLITVARDVLSIPAL